jgi:hypothetical protein
VIRGPAPSVLGRASPSVRPGPLGTAVHSVDAEPPCPPQPLGCARIMRRTQCCRARPERTAGDG